MLSGVLFANETTKKQFDETISLTEIESYSNYCFTETFTRTIVVEVKRVVSMSTDSELYEVTTVTIVTGQCTTCFDFGSSAIGGGVSVSCWGTPF